MVRPRLTCVAMGATVDVELCQQLEEHVAALLNVQCACTYRQWTINAIAVSSHTGVQQALLLLKAPLRSRAAYLEHAHAGESSNCLSRVSPECDQHDCA